jgi:putative redox protein
MDIQVTFPGGKKVDAQVGKHTVHTDQKAYGGGEDSAPAPFDYFLASLATCAGIFVKSFCDKRDIDASEIKIIQSHRTDPATRRLAGIHIDIILPEGFPEKYKAAVIKVADQCSVKRVLADPPEITTTASMG